MPALSPDVLYFVLHVMQKALRKYEKDFPIFCKYRFSELAKRRIPNHFTSEVDILMTNLLKTSDCDEFVPLPLFEEFEEHISNLQKSFDWKYFLWVGARYIVLFYAEGCVPLAKSFLDLVIVLQRHKFHSRKCIWRELQRIAVLEANAVENTEENVEAEASADSETREFVLRLIEYVYTLYLFDVPQIIQRNLQKFHENVEGVLDAVKIAVPPLLSDPTLMQETIVKKRESDAGLVLKKLIYGLRCLVEDYDKTKFIGTLKLYKDAVRDFKYLMENCNNSQLLWWKLKWSIRAILKFYGLIGNQITYTKVNFPTLESDNEVNFPEVQERGHETAELIPQSSSEETQGKCSSSGCKRC